MADLLSPEQIKMYKEAFSVFDKNGRGLISTKELGVVLRSLGQNPTEAELTDLIAEVDQDGNGEIDFNEFLLMMAKRSKDAETMEQALEAFRVFDKNNKGVISLNDLKNILQNLGEKLTPAEVDALLVDVQLNGNNEFDYREFVETVFNSL